MYKQLFHTDELENIVEEMVFEEINKIIKEESVIFCTCDTCVQDIAAIALNNLPPYYRTKMLYKKFPAPQEAQQRKILKVKVREEVLKAIEKTMEHPNH